MVICMVICVSIPYVMKTNEREIISFTNAKQISIKHILLLGNKSICHTTYIIDPKTTARKYSPALYDI